MRTVALSVALAALGLAACGSSGATSVDAGRDGDAVAEASIPDGDVVVPKTLACTGDKTACLSGTFALTDFTAKPSATKVTLFRLFPHGGVAPVATTPVASDGTFAFSGLAPWAHYFLQAGALFGTSSDTNAVYADVGELAVPSSGEPIRLVVRPVFLEILQQAPTGGGTQLAWASAHLYDPSSGAELTTGTVSLGAGGTTYPMPYGTNAGGVPSFNVNLPEGTAGGTSFTITTAFAGLPGSPVAWTLAGEPLDLGGAITSPSGTVPADTAVTVTWEAVPAASYTQTELFQEEGAAYVQRYVSPTVVSPDVTTETIPAAALASTGFYLLDEEYAKPTCPPSADGCVYNLSTASVMLDVQ